MNTTPKHRLRWFQYSLRSLFVLTVLVAIGGSWFAVKKQQVERQRAAVKAIEALRGHVTYDYYSSGSPDERPQPPGPAWLRAWLGNDFFAHVVAVNIGGKAVAGEALKHIEALPRLELLSLSNTQLTDAGLEHLEGTPQLKVLRLSDTRVTDDGLKHLNGLTQLESVNLDNSPVTDAGLKHLGLLPQLKRLSLCGTQVTDAGLEHLKDLPQLIELSLDGTQVSNAGLEHLIGLTQLEYLGIQNTKVTDEGANEFRRALPNCTVHRKSDDVRPMFAF